MSATASAPTARTTAEWLAVAHEAADAAARKIRPQFRRALVTDNKASSGRFDPVTVADRSAEQAIARTLRRRLPAHALVGEEFGAAGSATAGTPTWYIDPIDGTRAFILGLPTWGTLIGLTLDQRAVIGLMDQPFTGERFWAANGVARGRWPGAKERRLRTRPCAKLADAMLSTTDPTLFRAADEQAAFEDLRSAVRMTRYGGDCYAYCLLACGLIDVVLESGLKPYDVMALIPIIEGAGGRVTTWDGGSPLDGGRILACGDPRLHDTILRRLAGRR